MENSQGKCAKPPRSFTIDGTAVARMVASIAISPTLNMTDSRMGPRSDLKPTAARELICCSVEWAIDRATSNSGPAFPRRCSSVVTRQRPTLHGMLTLYMACMPCTARGGCAQPGWRVSEQGGGDYESVHSPGWRLRKVRVFIRMTCGGRLHSHG